MVMPGIIGGAIAAGGSVLGAGLGASSAKRNNEAMLEYQKHRYQYTKADMQAAGLNPMLAVKGASVGNAPSLQQSNAGSTLAQGLSSAANVMTQGYNAKTQRNTQEQQKAAVDSTVALQKVNAANSAADTLNKLEQGKQIEAQTRYINEQTVTQGAQRALMLKQQGNYTANTAKTQLESQVAQMQADYWNSPEGKRVYSNNQAGAKGLQSPATWMNYGGNLIDGLVNSAYSLLPSSKGTDTRSFGPFRITPKHKK